MSELEVDTEALRKAAGKGADTSDAVDSRESRFVEILSRLWSPAVSGSDQYRQDFEHGAGGQPGFRVGSEAVREGIGVQKQYTGDVSRAQLDFANQLEAAEEASRRSFE